MTRSDTNTRPKVAIIGGGVIGGGWAARFLLHGWDVSVFDPEPNAMERISDVLANARRALPMLADVGMPTEGTLKVSESLKEAVAGAAWIQESVPERIELKHRVIAEVQAMAPNDAIIASSTSGFKPSDLQVGSSAPGAILVAHPFNPVYLLPLVEVVTSQATAGSTLEKAQEILTAIGMKPLIVRSEIDAHIADRLLEAVWREALWLINDNIATTAEIDDAICFGFGLRWAQMGLFETYRLAGGDAGMDQFIRQFGPALKWPWTKLTDVPELTEELISKIVEQSRARAGSPSIREVERIRDDNLVAIMRALKERRWGVGEFLHDHDRRLTMSERRGPRNGAALSGQPLRMLDLRVLPGWIDYNDHMTEHRYLQVFGETTDAFLQHIGLDRAYLNAGYSYYTVETRIVYIHSVNVNQQLYTTTQVLDADSKRVRLLHRMHQADDDKVVSYAEHLLLHVDTKANRACAADHRVLAKLMPIVALHVSLDRPQST